MCQPKEGIMRKPMERTRSQPEMKGEGTMRKPNAGTACKPNAHIYIYTYIYIYIYIHVHICECVGMCYIRLLFDRFRFRANQVTGSGRWNLRWTIYMWVSEPWIGDLGERGACEVFWRMTRRMCKITKSGVCLEREANFRSNYFVPIRGSGLWLFFRRLQEATLKIELLFWRNANFWKKKPFELLGTTSWKVMGGGAGIPIVLVYMIKSVALLQGCQKYVKNRNWALVYTICSLRRGTRRCQVKNKLGSNVQILRKVVSRISERRIHHNILIPLHRKWFWPSLAGPK